MGLKEIYGARGSFKLTESKKRINPAFSLRHTHIISIHLGAAGYLKEYAS